MNFEQRESEELNSNDQKVNAISLVFFAFEALILGLGIILIVS